MKDTAQSKQSVAESVPVKNHNRQSAWQIWLPFGFLLALFIGVGVLAVLFSSGYVAEPALPDQQSPLAKGAVIFLVSGACLGSLFQLVIMLGLVLLNGKIIKGLPEISQKIQNGFHVLENLGITISDKFTAPIISIAALKAALTTLLNRLQFWKDDQQNQ